MNLYSLCYIVDYITSLADSFEAMCSTSQFCIFRITWLLVYIHIKYNTVANVGKNFVGCLIAELFADLLLSDWLIPVLRCWGRKPHSK